MIKVLKSCGIYILAMALIVTITTVSFWIVVVPHPRYRIVYDGVERYYVQRWFVNKYYTDDAYFISLDGARSNVAERVEADRKDDEFNSRKLRVVQ